MRGAAAHGPKIKRLRKQLGLTQAELAQIAGCDVKTVGRAEQGQTLDTYILRKLAQALGVAYAAIVREPKAPMNHESLHAQLAHAWFEAFFQGDVSALAKAFRRGGTMRIPGEAELPGAGFFRGRQELSEGFASIFALIEVRPVARGKCEVDAKDQHVFARGRALLTARGKSTPCLLEAALVFRFQQRRIAELVVYFDTLAVHRFLGAAKKGI
jgi:transcriptional regulator with XRE-family HTH domain